MSTPAGSRAGGSERDRDLVVAIRAELAAIAPARPCCRAAERAGLGRAADGEARTPAVARLAVRLDAPAGGGRSRLRPAPAGDFDWVAGADHCRTAWLRGALLAHGSLSLGTGRSHLELVLPPDRAAELGAHLVALGHPAAFRIRRGKGVLTWKSADAILALLRRLGATASALELETRLVTHQLHGHLNRVLNAETANLRRSAGAAARQVIAVERLRGGGGWAALAPHERAVAEARVADPGATLAEVAEGAGIGRARAQRAFRRIERLAEEERPDVG